MGAPKMTYSNWDRHGNCPICKRSFRSDSCPHSIGDVENHFSRKEERARIHKEIRKAAVSEQRVREIVREELDNVLRETRQ